MNAPKQVDLLTFNLMVTSYYNNRVEQRGEGHFCKVCGEEIKYVRGYISLHDIRFNSCAGWGEVANVNLPYCPKCESVPEQSGCVHVEPTFTFRERPNLLAVLTARQPGMLTRIAQFFVSKLRFA
jgi:hypothetical protein